MHLHFAAIMLLIFDHINKIISQGIPASPCPKMFQYRYDGSEWFGVLSVRNPDFGQPLHLRVTLSMRGKPATNYLGEIELLTRGQFLSDAPILYKIKFPQNHFPPKLLQIAANNQVICLGAADHSILVTQIQLEHTRKYTFLPEEIPPTMHYVPSSPPSLFLPAATATGGLEAGHSIGMKKYSVLPTNSQFDTKHLPFTNMPKNPMSHSKDICGTIDERIRFQALHALKQSTDFMASRSVGAAHTNPLYNIDSSLLSTILTRQSDEMSKSERAAEAEENGGNSGDDEESSPPIVVSDTDYDFDDAALDDGSVAISELSSVSRGAWPWLAAVYVNNLTSLAYQCGGTLVSSRLVISAAHCFHLLKQSYTPNEILVFLGRHNLKNWNEDGSLAAPVDDIFIHPDYSQHLSSYDADIAVLLLKNEVRFNTFIRPACLWSGSTRTQYIDGEHGVVVGWGLGSFNTTKHTSTTSTVPKMISTPIVSNDVCFQAVPKYHSLSSNRTFCAGIVLQAHKMTKTKIGSDGKSKTFQRRLNQGPCAGDSGAGLMIFKNKRWMLRGTVSGLLSMQSSDDDIAPPAYPRFMQTCSINQYVIYTDVAKFLDWIYAFITKST